MSFDVLVRELSGKRPLRSFNIKRILLAALLLSMVSCSFGNDYEQYREIIRKRLRDPESATFQNESIRTLWSKEGSRKMIYCAMVNSNNAYGGKTGFGPAQVMIAVKDANPKRMFPVSTLYPPGKSFMDPAMHPDHYLDCVRDDTQRRDEDIFSTYPTYGRTWDNAFKAEIDKQYPVLSNDSAPQL